MSAFYRYSILLTRTREKKIKILEQKIYCVVCVIHHEWIAFLVKTKHAINCLYVISCLVKLYTSWLCLWPKIKFTARYFSYHLFHMWNMCYCFFFAVLMKIARPILLFSQNIITKQNYIDVYLQLLVEKKTSYSK